MPPAEMVEQTGKIDYDEAIEAVQAVKRYSPYGHLAPRAEPESVLREHLTAQVRRLLDPGIEHQVTQPRPSEASPQAGDQAREGEATAKPSGPAQYVS